MLNFLPTVPAILIFIWSWGATFINNNITGYNLRAPDAYFILPDTLREVSGITAIDSTSFACVKDENGIIFIYDAFHNKITKQYSFNIDGDYEGITKVENNLYVLRSDGTLFEIVAYKSEKFKLNSYTTGIPANNNEGLCYDKDNKRLLIACKSKTGKGVAYKNKRVIYGFDLKTKSLTKTPVFDFDLQVIKQFALNNKINLPTRIKKKGKLTAPIIKFRTSAIGIHPVTKKLYLLSAAEHLLFVFNSKGGLEHIEPLDPVLFNKAEGITFLENGDMAIANEGQNKKPTLLLFHYIKK